MDAEIKHKTYTVVDATMMVQGRLNKNSLAFRNLRGIFSPVFTICIKYQFSVT